ncbi:hypothetical protein RRG08_033469 [Elysia crispata]|uniref:Uncharacterized protein n=1 Tax=Elysia crispata TaxID=231223 RepID=A0AAE1AU41_9GAST|nr:hypothetical protein RRG08_033469 [Elysia crispata]
MQQVVQLSSRHSRPDQCPSLPAVSCSALLRPAPPCYVLLQAREWATYSLTAVGTRSRKQKPLTHYALFFCDICVLAPLPCDRYSGCATC